VKNPPVISGSGVKVAGIHEKNTTYEKIVRASAAGIIIIRAVIK